MPCKINFYQETKLNTLIIKCLSRALPLILVVTLSYIAAKTPSIDALSYEKSIRELGLYLAILSTPFLNSLILGQFKEEIDFYNEYYNFVIIIIITLLLLTGFLITANILSTAYFAYNIRYFIARNSLALRMKMSFFHSIIYFGCLPCLGSIYLIQKQNYIVIFSVTYLSLMSIFLLKRAKFKKLGFVFWLGNTKQKNIFALSLTSILLNNLDIIVVAKIILLDQDTSLIILYTKRCIMVMDLIILTIIQSSTIKEINALNNQLIALLIFVTTGLILTYPLFFQLMNLNVGYNLPITLFILLSSAKSISIITERRIIENSNLNKYVKANGFMVLINLCLVFFINQLHALIIILFLVTLSQILIRRFYELK